MQRKKNRKKLMTKELAVDHAKVLVERTQSSIITDQMNKEKQRIR